MFALVTVVSFLCINIIGAAEFDEALSAIKPTADAAVQAKAAEGVIERLLGSDEARHFSVVINEYISADGRDTFHLFKAEDSEPVTVTGSSGVSAAWGFHFYIKNYCNCHVSWDGDQVQLPHPLPTVNVTKSSVDRFKYYQNVVTSSYSFVWWNWSRWEREIDWMALNGINLALAFTAQEAIWQRVYDGLGLSNTGFTGPAFLAWNRMGNVRNFGRGLSANWHKESIDLQHLILDRMRELGMIPILPAFAGILPRSFKKKFPISAVVNITKWNSFDDEYCCPYLLHPKDPMFSVISRIFLREYTLEFGTDHVYNCDTFNENTPPSSDPVFLKTIAESIYDGMSQTDPLAVWMVQGWMFIHPFWGKEQVKAFVSGVPIGRMLILDLQADLTPQYEVFESFYGQPFIWCTLHNFGGQLGLYGYLNLVNEGVVKARAFPNSTMVGIGIAPEGIDQNYIMYEFTVDSALRLDAVDLTKWVSSYCQRRYKVFIEELDKAWFILKETVYNYNPESAQLLGRLIRNRSIQGVHISKNILTKRPSLAMGEIIWYSKSEVFEVFKRFVDASKIEEIAKSKLFQHDFIDVTRQVIQLAVGSLYSRFMSGYLANDIVQFQNSSGFFMDMLDDLDQVLGTGRKFLLGRWLEDAKAAARNVNETYQYEFNARNQITLWGPRGEVRDYAAKQWSGLVRDYYKPRWGIFVSALNKSLTENVKYDGRAVKSEMFYTVEQPFSYAHVEYPTEPVGNTVEVITEFNSKWIAILTELFNN